MIPSCQKCGAEVSVSLSLPAVIAFSKVDEEACVATISTDTGDLHTEFYVTCECQSVPQAQLTNEDADRLVAVLAALGKRYAPELDCLITAQDLENDVEEAIGA